MDNRDYIDGRWVEPTVITGDETLTGTHRGTVQVREGATLQLLGTLQGTLGVESSARVTIAGECAGTLSVSSGASVVVSGKQRGTVHVSAGGEVVVQRTGLLAGTVHSSGVIRNSGTRGGPVSGDGVIEDLPGSTVKQPVMRDGMAVYSW